MVQEQTVLGMQYELLQIDGVAKEGERGRAGLAGRQKIPDDIDFESTEEWEWPRNDIREFLDIRPVVVHEINGPDLLSVGGKTMLWCRPNPYGW